MVAERGRPIYRTRGSLKLNGRVRFAGRRDLVSARVPSHFKAVYTPALPWIPIYDATSASLLSHTAMSFLLPTVSAQVTISGRVRFNPSMDLRFKFQLLPGMKGGSNLYNTVKWGKRSRYSRSRVRATLREDGVSSLYPLTPAPRSTQPPVK
jgi:hypothetical protein